MKPFFPRNITDQQFYAISAERKLTHPAVLAITSQARAALSD